MVHATAAGCDDVVVTGKVANEQVLGRGGVLFATAVTHGLATAGLIEWIVHLTTDAFEQLERGDADIREEGIDETRNKQGDFHWNSYGVLCRNRD